MIIKFNKDQEIQEIEMNDIEREMMRVADDMLRNLEYNKKELMKSIIENNLINLEKGRPDPNLLIIIGKNIASLTNSQTVNFLFLIASNPLHATTILDKLEKDHIISEDTSKFVFEIAAKYGIFLNTLSIRIERPYDWIRIESNVLIINNSILKLRSEIRRADGSILQFTSSLDGVITITGHFIHKINDMINIADKKELSMLDKNRFDVLAEMVTESKELYDKKILENTISENNTQNITRYGDLT